VAARPRPARLPRLRRVAASLLGLALLAGCVAKGVPEDAHVPDFARRPYEPFGREAAVAIALREWRLWGQPVQDSPTDEEAEAADPARKPERQPGLWQRVGEYWWLGLDADQPARAFPIPSRTRTTSTGLGMPHATMMTPGPCAPRRRPPTRRSAAT
jgi:hypothetical protein